MDSFFKIVSYHIHREIIPLHTTYINEKMTRIIYSNIEEGLLVEVALKIYNYMHSR